MSTLPSWERGRRWSWKAARRSGDPFHRPFIFMIYGTRSGRPAGVPGGQFLHATASPSKVCLCVPLRCVADLQCTGWFSWSGNGQRPSNWKVARMTKHATAVPCALPVPAEAAIGSSNLSARAGAVGAGEWTPGIVGWAGPGAVVSADRSAKGLPAPVWADHPRSMHI
jgi:hypothetical protein